MQESIESSKFVSHRARISGEFYTRKDSQSGKFERRPQIFIKLGLESYAIKDSWFTSFWVEIG